MQDIVRDLKFYNEFLHKINIKYVIYNETYYIYIYKVHTYKGSTM